VLICTKFLDVKKITLNDLYELAGHFRFSKETILETEREVLKALGYKVRDKQLTILA
jgi:hypothetical protein